MVRNGLDQNAVSRVEIRKNNLSSHFNKCDYFIVENDQAKLNLTIFFGQSRLKNVRSWPCDWPLFRPLQYSHILTTWSQIKNHLDTALHLGDFKGTLKTKHVKFSDDWTVWLLLVIVCMKIEYHNTLRWCNHFFEEKKLNLGKTAKYAQNGPFRKYLNINISFFSLKFKAS